MHRILVLTNRLSIAIWAAVAFVLPASALAQANGSARIRIESDPPEAEVRVDGQEAVHLAPVELILPAGNCRIEVALPGHVPLVENRALEEGQQVGLRFVLVRDRPERPPPEELGLRYDPVLPLLPEESVTTTLDRFLGVSETFSVIPLGMGLWLKISDDEAEHANTLIVTGLALTAGTYLLGRYVSSRRLAGIRTENERIREANSQAKANNLLVDKEIDQYMEEMLSAWQVEVLNRGRVVVLEGPR